MDEDQAGKRAYVEQAQQGIRESGRSLKGHTTFAPSPVTSDSLTGSLSRSPGVLLRKADF